jgi:hypothetical protein
LAKGERKPPGLPSIHKAKADRTQGRGSRGSPSLWLGIVASLVGYRWSEQRQLDGAKQALLSKERAVRASVGGEWFPLRDRIEKVVLDAAASKDESDFVESEARRWDFRTVPGLYLRLRLADAKDVATLRHAAADSQRDGFVGCLLHEPNAAAAHGDPDAGAFAEQPWNWQKAYAATRILTDDWTEQVLTSGDPIRLRIFEQQYDKAMRQEIPAAIDLVKRAQFFLLVLDENSPDVHPAEAGAPITEADLQRAPHFARVQLVDLRNGKEILRVRRAAGASFYFGGGKVVTDPETLDAMQRQVNNCALAKEVDRAIKDAQAK